jgi:hypothetical protein
MSAEQAKRVAADMESHGWNTMLRLQGQQWVVKAINADSGADATVKSVAEWEAIKGEAEPVPVVASGWNQGSLL